MKLKQTTFILESEANSLLDSFVKQISEKGKVHVLTASEENLIALQKATKFSEYTSGIVAFGDGEEFNQKASSLTSLTFSSADAILIKEQIGVYTEDQAEELYKTYLNDNLPKTYQLFKSRNMRIVIKEKIEKLCKVYPPFINFLKNEYEAKNKKNKTIDRCNWI